MCWESDVLAPIASIYKLIHQGDIPAVKLGAKTIRVNRRALEEYLQRAVVSGEVVAA
ncbi:helix-turn-helix domain-containing protein [Olegusella massiliensis]|uniref:helix-turn-helix domain-containing protein n=1 Tax=Olegusella massiliensis TaxID=1776381 RepID=UPI0009DD3EC1|nr:helix-turn-helix domain-containing protein [Coriobacteriaceae bacterium]